jgi:hypothetical protein
LTQYFEVGRASWQATHIVVVKTTAIDGTFEVLESWKGDLPVGSHVVIPELIPAVNAVPISAYPKGRTLGDQGGVGEQVPRQPVGSRLVLFLKRNGDDPVAKGEMKNRDWSGWARGDHPDSLRISAVWIDQDRTYSFQPRGFTSSPLALSVRGEISKEDRRFVAESEEELKRGVERVLQVQEDMKAAIAVEDGRERALRLKPYVQSKIVPARLSALEELGKAGPAAVSTIDEMLDDPAFAEWSSELVDAMVKAGGRSVGAELNRRLEQDVAFWRYTGPSLSRGWWTQDPTPESPLQARYGRTYRLIYELEQVDYPGALNTAIEMRDLWRTLTPLDQKDEQNQMLEECDKLIALLQTK